MKTVAAKDRLEKILGNRDEVLFAYIQKSVFYSDNPKDIDLAVL
jgi:hypothetical protein